MAWGSCALVILPCCRLSSLAHEFKRSPACFHSINCASSMIAGSLKLLGLYFDPLNQNVCMEIVLSTYVSAETCVWHKLCHQRLCAEVHVSSAFCVGTDMSAHPVCSGKPRDRMHTCRICPLNRLLGGKKINWYQHYCTVTLNVSVWALYSSVEEQLSTWVLLFEFKL